MNNSTKKWISTGASRTTSTTINIRKSRRIQKRQKGIPPKLSIKVGEIFREAGNAFNRLAELTINLDPVADSQSCISKWTDVEIDMLGTSVHRFAADLDNVNDHIKKRTGNGKHNRITIKKKVVKRTGTPKRKVTLNKLNATENEADLEGLTMKLYNEKKMEMEGFDEDVKMALHSIYGEEMANDIMGELNW